MKKDRKPSDPPADEANETTPPMDESTAGFELSLLEGMDESLLARLFRADIRTREQLEARMTSQESRIRLAEELGVSNRRVEVLHHLNFLMPEERADQLLELERRLEDKSDYTSREVKLIWRSIMVLGLAIIAAALLAVAFLRPQAPQTVTVPVQADNPAAGTVTVQLDEAAARRLTELEARLKTLEPLIGSQAEGALLEAVGRLGPAPDWNAGAMWTEEEHKHLITLLGTGDAAMPPRAISLTLLKLSDLERTPLAALGPYERAQRAAALAAEFPELGGLSDVWDAAAVLLSTRLRSRALGLAPAPDGQLASVAAAPWPWTHPGFLTCEDFTARLEALPIGEEMVKVWSETLVQIRDAADDARADLGTRPEAQARHYWLRRSEMEFAVVCAMLGRSNMLPYHELSPDAFLRQRKDFLLTSWSKAPITARAPLAWLALEHEEALRLVDWLNKNAVLRDQTHGKPWVDAVLSVESLRADDFDEPGGYVFNRLKEALAASGTPNGGNPWIEARTQLEAAHRPLLIETRLEAAQRNGESSEE